MLNLNTTFILIVVILILYNLYNTLYKEGLVSKPTEHEKELMSQQVLLNKELFNSSSLNLVKNKIDWIDPVSYEDMRTLYKNNNLTASSIKKLL